MYVNKKFKHKTRVRVPSLSPFSFFFASSTVCAVNSYCFLAGNLRQLEDFQFEVFAVPEAVSLSYQPSDLVVEPLHPGIADMPECPVADDPIQFVPNRLRHRPQFRDPGFFGKAAPTVKRDPRMV